MLQTCGIRATDELQHDGDNRLYGDIGPVTAYNRVLWSFVGTVVKTGRSLECGVSLGLTKLKIFVYMDIFEPASNLKSILR